MKFVKPRRVLVIASLLALGLVPATAFGASTPPKKNQVPAPATAPKPGTFVPATNPGNPTTPPKQGSSPTGAGSGLLFPIRNGDNPVLGNNAPAPAAAPAPASGPAAGAAPAPAQGSGNQPPIQTDDISYDELTNGQYIFNFDKAVENRNGVQTAVLYGTFFNNCQGMLQITNTMSSGGHNAINTAGIAGFEITDPGSQFRSCMQQDEAANWACGTAHPCVSISTVPGATMSLAKMNHGGQIEIVQSNPAGDRNPFFTANLGLTFQTADEQRAAQAAQLMRQVRSCTQPADLPIREEAANELVQLGQMTQDQADQIGKQDEQTQLSALQKRIAKDQPSVLIPDVQSFATSYPDMADKCATILEQIAEKEVSSDNANEQSYKDAADALNDAKNLDGLSQTATDEVTQKIQENQIGLVGYLAQNGDVTELMKMNTQLSSQLCGGNVSLYAIGASGANPSVIMSVCTKVSSVCRKANSIEGMSSCEAAEKNVADVAKLFALGVQEQQQQQQQMQMAMMQMQRGMMSPQQGFTGGFGSVNLNGTPGGSLLGASPFGIPTSGFGQTAFNPSYGGSLGSPVSPYGTTAPIFNPSLGASSTSFGPMWAGGQYGVL